MKTHNPKLALASAGLALLLLSFLWLIPFDIPTTSSWFNAEWLKQYALMLWVPIWLLVCIVRGHMLSFACLPAMRRGVAYTRYHLMEYGGGFYGVVAVVMFINLELARLWQATQELTQFEGSWIKALIPWLMDFGIDSIMNGIYSFVWPAFHHKVFPAAFWPAIAVAAGVYYGGTCLFRDKNQRDLATQKSVGEDTTDDQ